MNNWIIIGPIVLAAVIFALIFRYRRKALKKIKEDIRDLVLENDDD